MLYGRDAILRDIKRQLPTDRAANIILLEGNRRTGKTSILRRLERPGEIPGWIPVNISLQGGEGPQRIAGLTSREIFRHLAYAVAGAVDRAGTPVWPPDVPPPDPKRAFRLQIGAALDAFFSGDHPFERFEIYVEAVIGALAPRRLLLMLDEFDKIQEGIDSGVTSPQVPENLRYLFHNHPELGGILSGSRRLTRLRNEYWSALFGIGYSIPVGPLEVADARALVTGPVEGRLVYAPEARDRIVDLCACQPYLIQMLCNRIFKQTQERGERIVLLDAVERAAAEMTADNEHFETLWGYARTDRRRLILVLLCELGRGAEGRPLDAGTLEDELRERGVILPPDGLGPDMALLRELDLVELRTYDGYQRYRLTIPLMAEWIRRNKDFSDLARRAAREHDDLDE
jgi:type I restriction enzyme M protein